MADTQSPVALNIGSQKLAIGTFSSGKGDKLTLQKYATRSILADPAAEMTRMPQVFQAIGELAKEVGVNKANAYYAISGNSVFTRFAKLPALDASNIEEIVGLEAQQQFPVQLNDLAWDFQLLPPTEGEQEVALVAIRKDSLNEYYDTVTGAGIGTASIGVAPTALFSAFKHAYPEVSECSLLVDIGAKATNLIYIDGDRMFIRTAQFGGATITSAIAKAYNLSFADAEVQKISNGLVGLSGGFGDQVTEDIAALATAIRTAFSKLPAEIARTTNHYRSQQGGNAPTQVFLAGGGANLAYTKEFFEEKLKLPVHFFNPLKNVSLGSAVDADLASREAHTMGELVGLALNGTGKSAVSMDLVPEAVAKKRDINKRKPMLTAAAAIFLAGLAAWAGSKYVSAGKAKEKVAEVESKVRDLSGPADQIKRQSGREDNIDKVVYAYSGAQEKRTQWIKVIDKLAKVFAHDAVWMVDFEPIAGYQINNAADTVQSAISKSFTQAKHGNSYIQPIPKGIFQTPEGALPEAFNAIRIKGFWRENPDSYRALYNLLGTLKESPEPFDPKIKDLPDEKIIKQIVTNQSSGEYGWPFEIVLPLQKPISLN